MEYPAIQHMCAPEQTTVEDVPMLLFDINNPVKYLRRTNAKRLTRASLIASVLVKGHLPVCPLPNPLTEASHHRIRLKCERDRNKVVELFIKDTDLYLIGFRVGILNVNGEVERWKDLFVFDDLYHAVPAFLNPVKMKGIYSAHSKVGGFPGKQAMEDMFMTFAGFEDRVSIVMRNGKKEARDIDDGTRRDMLVAFTSAIIVFCESLRFKTVCSQSIRCLKKEEGYITTVSTQFWNLFNSWGTFSKDTLMRRMTNIGYKMDDDLSEDIQYAEQGLRKVNHLFGSKGLMKLCKVEQLMVTTDAKLEELRGNHAAIHFRDPMFRRQ